MHATLVRLEIYFYHYHAELTRTANLKITQKITKSEQKVGDEQKQSKKKSSLLMRKIKTIRARSEAVVKYKFFLS